MPEMPRISSVSALKDFLARAMAVGLRNTMYEIEADSGVRAVVLKGEAGIGKTRLINELVADGDPNDWKIVDNKLYLNLSADIQERWEGDIPGFNERADTNWKDIADKSPSELQAQ